jgi:hypothetical protein
MTEDRRSGEDRRAQSRGGRRGSDKVPCPLCDHPTSHAYYSRGVERYRECLECRARYSTREVLERIIRAAS